MHSRPKPSAVAVPGSWKRLEDVEFATLECVDRLNHRRLLEPLGFPPPGEFGDRCHQHLQGLAEAAGPTATRLRKTLGG